MADVRGLAFVRYAEGVAHLPAGVQVVPLWPSVAVPREHRVVARPEDLLRPNDEASIAQQVSAGTLAWARQAGAYLKWDGVDLADCFAFDLRSALADLLKTSMIIRRALEASEPQRLFVDDETVEGAFPPYPYLHAILPLLKTVAEDRRIPLERLGVRPRRTPRRARLSTTRAYAKLVARKSASLLETGKVPVAVGPYPEFYAPLARSWQRRRQPLVVATSMRSLIRASARDGYSVLPFEHLLGSRDRSQVEAFCRTVETKIAATQIHGLTGTDSEMIASLFRDHVLRRLTSELPELMAVGIAFQRGLEKASHVIVVETSSPLSKSVVRYARREGVPVTVLQHGILGGVASYGQTEGDRIAAWGPQDAAWFRAHLGKDVEVAATGCPRYDRLPLEPGGAVPRALREIPDGRKVVLFAAQPFVPSHPLASPWTNTEALTMAIAAASTSPDNVLLIKWHPSQEPEPFPRPPGSESLPVVEVHHADTFACLTRADLVLVVSSTVALEAMFLDRPVVFLGPPDPESEFDPPRWGAGLRALSRKEAEDHVRRLQNHPGIRRQTLQAQQEVLERAYAPLDGHAADRVVEFVTGR